MREVNKECLQCVNHLNKTCEGLEFKCQDFKTMDDYMNENRLKANKEMFRNMVYSGLYDDVLEEWYKKRFEKDK